MSIFQFWWIVLVLFVVYTTNSMSCEEALPIQHQMFAFQVQAPAAELPVGTVGTCRRAAAQLDHRVNIEQNKYILMLTCPLTIIILKNKMLLLLTGYITGEMYSRQQSGPGGPATPNAPPNMSSSSANSKPGSDYSNYAGYGSYSADTGYGAPPRTYGSDAGSQVGGYTSQPPNAGAKHFNDFKEWPSSWQPFDSNNSVIPAAHIQTTTTFYFSAFRAFTACSVEKFGGDEAAGITLKHVSNFSNMSMCCNSWRRVGLINMKRAAGLVTPANFNYSD